ncbi:hypothetical protein RUM43_013892 [Polyplax serrata]|uniref:Uncharacterized protein n=1 Tax=Polyplax serrata TaxID=468196 RepID=A0AAN8S9L4_POLSC
MTSHSGSPEFSKHVEFGQNEPIKIFKRLKEPRHHVDAQPSRISPKRYNQDVIKLRQRRKLKQRFYTPGYLEGPTNISPHLKLSELPTRSAEAQKTTNILPQLPAFLSSEVLQNKHQSFRGLTKQTEFKKAVQQPGTEEAFHKNKSIVATHLQKFKHLPNDTELPILKERKESVAEPEDKPKSSDNSTATSPEPTQANKQKLKAMDILRALKRSPQVLPQVPSEGNDLRQPIPEISILHYKPKPSDELKKLHDTQVNSQVKLPYSSKSAEILHGN